LYNLTTATRCLNVVKGKIMAILTANNPLIVTIKNVYGKEMVYPANSVAQIFADIARQTTLSRETLKLAQGLGYKIEVQQPAFDLNAPYNKEFLGAQPARACEDY
jgi:hypothetical protein